ncbi:uncharacterized protein V6R79_016142 [Siganus canaliculatus]
MKVVWCLAAALAVVFCAESDKHTPPKVNVYSRDPGQFGVKNILICHVSDFHPPDIDIKLLKNGDEIPKANQTDLSFGTNWRFYLTRTVDFTPERDHAYICRVTHGTTVREFAWEAGHRTSLHVNCENYKSELIMMKVVWCLAAALAVVFCAESDKHTPPKVQVYSRNPGQFGVKNILICHVSDFHPPDIDIKLLKDGDEIPKANQTDLSFGTNWRFYLTKTVDFTPERDHAYICRVTHGTTVREFAWEAVHKTSLHVNCENSKSELITMKVVWCLAAALAVVFCAESDKHTPPKVNVYSRDPGQFGVKNILICHVSDFHPPDIDIKLLKDGDEIPKANQTDLSFGTNWRFYLTKTVDFTPERDHKYICRVTHGTTVRDYAWEPNM